MHDCFGKPLKPFDRVRAATKEELETHGHPEAQWGSLAILAPEEQFVLPAYEGTDTCNVLVTPGVTCQTTWPVDVNGEQGISPKTRGPVTTHTARTLVKVG